MSTNSTSIFRKPLLLHGLQNQTITGVKVAPFNLTHAHPQAHTHPHKSSNNHNCAF